METKCIKQVDKETWKEILSRKKSLSDEEANDIENIVRKVRVL